MHKMIASYFLNTYSNSLLYLAYNKWKLTKKNPGQVAGVRNVLQTNVLQTIDIIQQ